MSKLTRRQFGADILRAGALLGLRSIGGSQVIRFAATGSLFGVSACSDSSKGSMQSRGDSRPAGDSGAAGDSGLEHADVVIVGSGYGGAVVAKRLTERGVKVLMFERGAPLERAGGRREDLLRGAQCGRARPTKYSSNLLGGKQFQDSATYHAVGGCPLGEATDDYGRVKGYDGLYISDGSLIPRGIVANPSLTVTALAERNIERIAAEDF